MWRRKCITYTLNDILNLWLNSKTNLKIKSLQTYEHLIKNYIYWQIGKIEISNVTKEDVEDLFLEFKKKKLAITTQKTVLYILKSSFNYASFHHYRNDIDLSGISLKTVTKTIFVLSKEEQIIIEKYLKDKMNIRMICLLLCLYTGLRVGEVSGLKWEDVDFVHKSLTVKRTIERIKQNTEHSKTILIETTPKSNSSNRMIPIPDFILMLLQKFKSENHYFILSKSEKLYDPRLLESCYQRVLKNCHIRHHKFHTLRHTFATRSIESKMDIKTLSEILGHSSIEITLKLYVHPTYEMKKNSIEHLVDFMMT